MKKFSVVIATCNRQDYVLQAIQSVVEQTMQAVEIIVVVDGSEDASAAEIRRHFPQVLLFEQPNRGVSVARNAAIAHASGNWICFLDDDDLWHREKLAITAAYLDEHPDCKALCNPIWFFSDLPIESSKGLGVQCDFHANNLEQCHQMAATCQSRNRFDYLNVQGHSHELMLENSRSVMSSSVVARELLITAGGFCPSQSCGDDWTMFVNVARLTEWHTLLQKLGFSRLHHKQNTRYSENGLHILAGKVNAWHGGRPLAGRVSWREAVKRLELYGPVYRAQVQSFFWEAVRSRQFRTAAAIRTFGKLLLPRWRDRVYAMLPPPLTWRIERYLLGMHQ